MSGENIDILVKCCVCHRIREGNEWTGRIVEEDAGTIFSHGYCPECLDKACADLDAYEAGKIDAAG